MQLGLTIHPDCLAWAQRVRQAAAGALLDRPIGQWRTRTRRELGLDTDRPIIATGHQTLLWHPGILVKYLLTDAVASAHELATANLIVDQHAGGYGEFDVPIRREDGSLAVHRRVLARTPNDEPMALQEPFTPPEPAAGIRAALPEVARGVGRIHDAVRAHRKAPNAALQMAGALGDLMRPWVDRMPSVPATALLKTALGRAMLGEMARDPWRCALAYNEAVAAIPGAGIGRLLVRDDYVELPLWRIHGDRKRVHAYDGDVQHRLDGHAGAPVLMPRALFMTALIRLGMCDLFVHGTGGANYDRAMERWIRNWLGAEPCPIAVATADLHLPLIDGDFDPADAERLTAAARRVWHDPEPPEAHPDSGPGPVKREFLATIADAPRRSQKRSAAYFAMHDQLAALRGVHGARVERARRRANQATRRQADAVIAARRDWAFPLYADSMIDELAAACAEAVGGACSAASR